MTPRASVRCAGGYGRMEDRFPSRASGRGVSGANIDSDRQDDTIRQGGRHGPRLLASNGRGSFRPRYPAGSRAARAVASRSAGVADVDERQFSSCSRSWPGASARLGCAWEVAGDPTSAPGPAEVPTQVEQAGLPDDGWKRSGDLEPGAALAKGRRVVVTEFDVEFVDYQFQLPILRQPMFKGPMISINPVHLAINVIGLGRKSTRMDEEEQQALASNLYNAFLENLRRRGLGLVSQDELHASPAYAELRKSSVVGSSWLRSSTRWGVTREPCCTRGRSRRPACAYWKGAYVGPWVFRAFWKSTRPARASCGERPCSDGGRGADPPGDAARTWPSPFDSGSARSEGNRARASQRDLLDHPRGIDDTPGLPLAGLGPYGDRGVAVPAPRRTDRAARGRDVLQRADGDAPEVHRPCLVGAETVMRGDRAATAICVRAILPCSIDSTRRSRAYQGHRIALRPCSRSM